MGQRLEAKVDDDYEFASQFLPLRELRRLATDDYEKAFLRAEVVEMSQTGRAQL